MSVSAAEFKQKALFIPFPETLIAKALVNQADSHRFGKEGATQNKARAFELYQQVLLLSNAKKSTHFSAKVAMASMLRHGYEGFDTAHKNVDKSQ